MAATEVYAFRDGEGCVPPPQATLARVLAEKIRADAVGYDLSRVTGEAGRRSPRGVHAGLNLWPVRAARRLPDRAPVAWAVWGLAVAGAAWAGWRTVGEVRT